MGVQSSNVECDIMPYHLRRIACTTVFMLILICFPALARQEVTLEGLNAELVKAAGKAQPAVVNISTKGVVPWRRYHAERPGSLGSGIIIDKRGYIITTGAVIANAREIVVFLPDEREFPCEIVGSDPATDIALLKIAGTVPADLPVVEMADSAAINAGEMVIAIRNPTRRYPSITMGVVSARGDELIGTERYIVTDVALSPGNEGGALLDVQGRLIGITTVIWSPSGESPLEGAAIPSNLIRAVVKELIDTGTVVRGWLGASLQDLTADIIGSVQFDGRMGAVVSRFVKGSPAEKSGMRAGDIIVSFDGVMIRDARHLKRLIAGKKPGEKASVRIFRSGTYVESEVTVGTIPEKPLDALDAQGMEDTLGIGVRDIDEELAYRYRLPDSKGVVIVTVGTNSPAANAGLAIGDLIKEIDRRPVESTITYRKILSDLAGRRRIPFLIKRKGVPRNIVVDIE